MRGDTLHFDLKKCAGALLNSDFALCHTGSKVLLEDLIPEFLLTELPRRFLLKRSELELDVDRKLGGGAVGSVYKVSKFFFSFDNCTQVEDWIYKFKYSSFPKK